jgi:hypothetical protein
LTIHFFSVTVSGNNWLMVGNIGVWERIIEQEEQEKKKKISKSGK